MERFGFEKSTVQRRGADPAAVASALRHALASCACLQHLVWVDRLDEPANACDMTPVLEHLSPTVQTVELSPPLSGDSAPWVSFVGSRTRPLLKLVTLHRIPTVRCAVPGLPTAQFTTSSMTVHWSSREVERLVDAAAAVGRRLVMDV